MISLSLLCLSLYFECVHWPAHTTPKPPDSGGGGCFLRPKKTGFIYFLWILQNENWHVAECPPHHISEWGHETLVLTVLWLFLLSETGRWCILAWKPIKCLSYWLTDFNGTSTCLRLFYVKELGNQHSLYIHIYIFCVVIWGFLLHTVLSNIDNF